MNLADSVAKSRFGIRAKLISLFVLIKVLPLCLLALLAWEGVSHLGNSLSEDRKSVV